VSFRRQGGQRGCLPCALSPCAEELEISVEPAPGKKAPWGGGGCYGALERGGGKEGGRALVAEASRDVEAWTSGGTRHPPPVPAPLAPGQRPRARNTGSRVGGQRAGSLHLKSKVTATWAPQELVSETPSGGNNLDPTPLYHEAMGAGWHRNITVKSVNVLA
jgi:hypothetical protein